MTHSWVWASLRWRRAESRLVDPLGSAGRGSTRRNLPGTRYFWLSANGTGGLGQDRLAPGLLEYRSTRGPISRAEQSVTHRFRSCWRCRYGQAWGTFRRQQLPPRIRPGQRRTRARAAIAVDGGPLIYYVFTGPYAAGGARTLHRADGSGFSMPPRWAVGYHQSRWGLQDVRAAVS